MKKFLSFIILTSLFIGLFSACDNKDERHTLPPIAFVQRTLEDGTLDPNHPKFSVVGTIKATQEINDEASLRFEYCNGYGRDARVTVTCAGDIITGSVYSTLVVGSDTASLCIPLHGIPEKMGLQEIGVSILAEGTSPLNTITSIMVGDPVEEYLIAFDEATFEGEIFDNIESSTLLKIPYTKGFGRNVTITVSSAVGLSGKKVIKLNGDYSRLEEGDPGVIEIPVSGIPNDNGDVELSVSVASAGGMLVEGTSMVQISENTDVFPELEFLPDMKLIGKLFRNALIGTLSDAKLNIPYKNGYGRNITIEMENTEGIYVDVTTVKLCGGAVNSSFDLQLQGTPEFVGEKELSFLVTTEEAKEYLLKVNVVSVSPNQLVLTKVVFSEDFYENAKLSDDASLIVTYENGYKRRITYSSVLDSNISGISIENVSNPITLSDNSGTFKVKLKGTALAKGSYPLMLVVQSEGEDLQTISTSIRVHTAIVSSDILQSTFEEKPIILNESNEIVLRVPYTNGIGSVVNVEVTGELCGSVSGVSLDKVNGILEIPLLGTPTSEFGLLNIRFSDLTTSRIWEDKLPFYAGNKIIFNGLNYYSIFLDIDNNGTLDAGEIWLDRNIGATSTNPGAFGNLLANMDCVGHYYQWGKKYEDFCPVIDDEGNIARDNDWVYPEIGTNWTSICPEGYRLPTAIEYKKLCDKIVSTDYYSSNYVKAAANMHQGKTREDFLTSFLKLPLGGWNNPTHAVPGVSGAYWTSEWNATTSNPFAFVVLNKEGVNIPNNYKSTAAANVRCVRNK